MYKKKNGFGLKFSFLEKLPPGKIKVSSYFSYGKQCRCCRIFAAQISLSRAVF
jgi:hypothetical protein